MVFVASCAHIYHNVLFHFLRLSHLPCLLLPSCFPWFLCFFLLLTLVHIVFNSLMQKLGMQWLLIAVFTPQFLIDSSFPATLCSQISSCKLCIHPGAGKIGILFCDWIIRQGGCESSLKNASFSREALSCLQASVCLRKQSLKVTPQTQDSHYSRALCTPLTHLIMEIQLFRMQP